MHSLWNSIDFVTRLNSWVQIAGVVVGISIVIISYHLAQLQLAKERPRDITNAQRNAFVWALEGTPRGSLKILVFSGDSETYSFALKIAELLRGAGYNVSDPEGFILFGAPPIGVALGCVNPDTPPPITEPIRLAFRAIGIEAKRQKSVGDTEDILRVVVGLKQ